LRQIIYGTTRLGLYRYFMDQLRKQRGGENPPLYLKALSSLISGAIGSFVGNPTDLVLIRFQSDA